MAKKAKQSDLPGLEERRIEDLHKAALDYVSVRDSRMELTEQEVSAKEKVLGLMKKHKRETYTCEGLEITIEHIDAKDNVKVKVHRAGDDEDKEDAA